jgi:hypothetical protein
MNCCYNMLGENKMTLSVLVFHDCHTNVFAAGQWEIGISVCQMCFLYFVRIAPHLREEWKHHWYSVTKSMDCSRMESQNGESWLGRQNGALLRLEDMPLFSFFSVIMNWKDGLCNKFQRWLIKLGIELIQPEAPWIMSSAERTRDGHQSWLMCN